MVKEFWQLFDRTYHGSIPAGLIFLPGEKLERQGFGWAPHTFMKPHELDYPDPFTKGPKTELHGEFGLRVRYPGVLLHCTASEDLRKSILATVNLPGQAIAHPFRFSVNRFQGYAIEPTEDEPFTGLERILSFRSQLAIVMTRPHPREHPKEIALLGENKKEKRERKQGTRTKERSTQTRGGGEGGEGEGNEGERGIGEEEEEGEEEVAYCCQTIRRVRIWHDTIASDDDAVIGSGYEMGLHHLSRSESRTQFECVGEVLDANQLWYVDGVVPGREDDLPAFRKAKKDQKVPGRAVLIRARRPRGLRRVQSEAAEHAPQAPLPPPPLPPPPPPPRQGIRRSRTSQTLRAVGHNIRDMMRLRRGGQTNSSLMGSGALLSER